MVVVSRFLPGEDAANVLKNLPLLFPTVHVVLLAGTSSEQQRAYIKIAHKYGLYNIVTGRLPGDRPYTIFVALTSAKDPEREGYSSINENLLPDMESQAVLPADQDVQPKSLETPLETPGLRGILENIADVETNDLKSFRQKLQDIVNMLDAEGLTAMQRTSATGKGILVLCAANKGGVGKTTVAVALATALSRAGVPTILVDYDFSAPDVAHLLGIKDVPGLEILAGKPVRENSIRDVIVRKENLDILPGPMNGTMPKFSQGQVGKITEVLSRMYGVVVGDTPPEYWTKPWLTEIFARADYVLAVVDQSVLSEQDTKSYAPYLLSMGVAPDRIGIVLNHYSPKLHNPRTVEKMFCSGFKKEIKTLPKVAAVIPENWEAYVQKGYKGEVAGLEDVHSQWHRLAENIAGMAGYGYRRDKDEKRSLGFLEKFMPRPR